METNIQSILQHWQAIDNALIPESIIQICEFMGEYKQGVAIYNSLELPTPADERWVGLCLVALGEREEAKEHYFKAINMGFKNAFIDMAFLSSLTGKPERALEELLKIDNENLSGYYKALWYRNMAFINICHYDIISGLDMLYKSWEFIQGTPEFNGFAPKLLSQIASTENTIGNKQKSLYYYDRALKSCNTKFAWSIKYNKANLLTDLGKFEEAEFLFEEVVRNSEVGIHVSGSLEALAKLNMIKKEFSIATELLERCAEFSIEKILPQPYFYANIHLAGLHALLGNKTKSLQ